MAEVSIGDRIDSLGVKADLQPGDLVTDVIVIGKVLSENNQVRLMFSTSEGIDFITRRGMVEEAKDATSFNLIPMEEDAEDA